MQDSPRVIENKKELEQSIQPIMNFTIKSSLDYEIKTIENEKLIKENAVLKLQNEELKKENTLLREEYTELSDIFAEMGPKITASQEKQRLKEIENLEALVKKEEKITELSKLIIHLSEQFQSQLATINELKSKDAIQTSGSTPETPQEMTSRMPEVSASSPQVSASIVLVNNPEQPIQQNHSDPRTLTRASSFLAFRKCFGIGGDRD